LERSAVLPPPTLPQGERGRRAASKCPSKSLQRLSIKRKQLSNIASPRRRHDPALPAGHRQRHPERARPAVRPARQPGGQTQVPITTYQSPQPGWMENDPEAFWQTLCQACQRLWASTAVPRGDCRRGRHHAARHHGVAGTDGQPLRPAIIWLTSAAPTGPAPGLVVGAAFAPSACGHRAPLPEGGRGQLDCPAPARTVGAHRHLFAALGLPQLPPHRAPGRFGGVAGGLRALRLQKGRWAPPHDWKWQALPVRPSMLPELVPPGTSSAGHPEAAQDTGIPAACPSCGRGRQGLRGARRGLPHARDRLPVLRHRRHHQHHHAALPGGHALHPATGRRAGHYNTEVQITRASGW
jgi:hypothetical protein